MDWIINELTQTKKSVSIDIASKVNTNNNYIQRKSMREDAILEIGYLFLFFCRISIEISFLQMGSQYCLGV